MKNFASAARLGGARAFRGWQCSRAARRRTRRSSAPRQAPTTDAVVTMSTSTIGATIVYSTDGSAPSCVKEHGDYLLGTGRRSQKTPSLQGDGLRAVARRKPHHHRQTTDQGAGDVAAPTFSPAAGTYMRPRRSASDGHRGRDDPYTSRRQHAGVRQRHAYTGPIEVAQSTTLKAVACKKGKFDSKVTKPPTSSRHPPPHRYSTPRPARTPANNTSRWRRRLPARPSVTPPTAAIRAAPQARVMATRSRSPIR